MKLKDIVKYSAITAAALPHIACISTGVCKGTLNYQGQKVDIPFTELWIANVVMSGVGNGMTGVYNPDPNGSNGLTRRFVEGATAGACLAPLEFIVGWTIGYTSSLVVDKVFY